MAFFAGLLSVLPRRQGRWGLSSTGRAWGWAAASVVAVMPQPLAARAGLPVPPAEAGSPARERMVPAAPPGPTQPVRPLGLRLPTDNRGLLEGRPEEFFMGVDRNVEGKTQLVWQAGQFGFVRDPSQLGAETIFIRFHEGLDIAPTLRDNRGEPLDVVRSIADGRVVLVRGDAGGGDYGNHIIIEHDWGYGSFYSLYAHLMKVEVELGVMVRSGASLGRLGYTGRGIDRRRAHLHLELNMLLSDRFEDWQRQTEGAGLGGGTLFRGHNLAGLDLAGLYRAHEADPGLTVPEFLATQEPYYRVLAPRGERAPSLVSRYPWLLGEAVGAAGAAAVACPSYEITLTASGLPLMMVPSSQVTPYPVVVAAVPFQGRHSWRTQGRVGGTGTAAELTPKGVQYVRQLMGTF